MKRRVRGLAVGLLAVGLVTCGGDGGGSADDAQPASPEATATATVPAATPTVPEPAATPAPDPTPDESALAVEGVLAAIRQVSDEAGLLAYSFFQIERGDQPLAYWQLVAEVCDDFPRLGRAYEDFGTHDLWPQPYKELDSAVGAACDIYQHGLDEHGAPAPGSIGRWQAVAIAASDSLDEAWMGLAAVDYSGDKLRRAIEDRQ